MGLTYIYGVGKSTAQKVLDEAGVGRDVKVQEWTDDQINDIRRILNEKYKLRANCSETQLNIKRLMDIGCYRGVRLTWSPSKDRAPEQRQNKERQKENCC